MKRLSIFTHSSWFVRIAVYVTLFVIIGSILIGLLMLSPVSERLSLESKLGDVEKENREGYAFPGSPVPMPQEIDADSFEVSDEEMDDEAGAVYEAQKQDSFYGQDNKPASKRHVPMTGKRSEQVLAEEESTRATSSDYAQKNAMFRQLAIEKQMAPVQSTVGQSTPEQPTSGIAQLRALNLTGAVDGLRKLKPTSPQKLQRALMKPKAPPALITGSVAGGEALRRDSSIANGRLRNENRELKQRKKAKKLQNKLKDKQAPRKALALAETVVADFYQQREQIQGLSYQEASGYWENSYVPGDPLLRHLQVRLNRQKLTAGIRQTALKQIWQPFDPPLDAALAVYLHSDKTAIQGPTRLLAQVGLKGSLRHSGRRPAMNVGIILDLRTALSNEENAAVRALLKAFVQARRSTDRFALTVAGVPGGTLLPPEDFRHGPLQVKMAQLFGQGAESQSAPTLNLVEATQNTMSWVQGHSKADALLGSSAVILISKGSFGSDLSILENLAHHSAIRGIPLSLIQLAAASNKTSLNYQQDEEIQRLTLIGQGNRRFLRRPDAATGLVDKELHSAGRTVARAVRLNIRLAPGVKLVDVIGSKPLAQQRSQQVRQAEQSLDQRLARTLGIQRDRSRDDAGIQIMIPAYHAGDSHSILLDVVVERPGPIMEVTMRYKDLVYLRNGSNQAQLSLGSQESPRGPLEYNVVKNLLAIQLANNVRRAGEYLEQNQQQAALKLLQRYQSLLQSVQQQTAFWHNDAELLQDQAMLTASVQQLNYSSATERRLLADRLLYAGFMKVLPESAEP
ncbi:hypothetical protein [Candidatus Venteria ishoeyi]|uniref:Uncharacterized protein n=1 Tax=Candidatus Venteria ishoeyi TaxID=1899563 RepID=A0A1H6FCF6_9GAMM|nr:hypothetical protein [Candidatus Venteria ishoeyi]SEH07081.1 Uncharacterised protein [Candidatus Venteria ishoeyi]